MFDRWRCNTLVTVLVLCVVQVEVKSEIKTEGVASSSAVMSGSGDNPHKVQKRVDAIRSAQQSLSLIEDSVDR